MATMPLDVAAATLEAERKKKAGDAVVVSGEVVQHQNQGGKVESDLSMDKKDEPRLDKAVLEWLLKVGFGHIAESLHQHGLNTIGSLISKAKSNPEFFTTSVEMKPMMRKKFIDMLRNPSHPNYPQPRRKLDFSEHVWYQVGAKADAEGVYSLVDPTVAAARAATAAAKGEAFTEIFTARTIGLVVESSTNGRRLPVLTASPDGKPHIPPGHRLVSVNGIDLAGSENTYAKALEIMTSAPRPVALGFRAPYELASLLEEFGEEAYFDAVRLQIKKKLPWKAKSRFTYKAALNIGEAGLVAAGLSESTAFRVWYRAKELLTERRRLGRKSVDEGCDISTHSSAASMEASVSSMDNSRHDWGMVDTASAKRAVEAAADKGEVYVEVFTTQNISLPVEPSVNPTRLPVLLASPNDKPHIYPGHRIVYIEGVDLAGFDDTYAKTLDIVANTERPLTIGFRAPSDLSDLLAEFDEESLFDAIRKEIKKRLPWGKRKRLNYKTVSRLGEAGLLAAGLHEDVASQLCSRAKELAKESRQGSLDRQSSGRLSDETVLSTGSAGSSQNWAPEYEGLGVGARKVANATKNGDVYVDEFTERKLFISMEADTPAHLPVLLASPEGKPYIAPGHRLVSVGGVELLGADDTHLKALMLLASAPRPVTLGFRASSELWNLLEEFDEVARFNEVRQQIKKRLPWAAGDRFTFKSVLGLGEAGLAASGLPAETAYEMFKRAKELTSSMDEKRGGLRMRIDSLNMPSPGSRALRLSKAFSMGSFSQSKEAVDDSFQKAGASVKLFSRRLLRASSAGPNVPEDSTVSPDKPESRESLPSPAGLEEGTEKPPSAAAPEGGLRKARAESSNASMNSDTTEKSSQGDSLSL